MSGKILIALILLWPAAIVGQELHVTFSATGEATSIDSVTATNLTTNQRVTFPGSATLVLSSGTGIDDFTTLPDGGIIFPNPFSGRSSMIAKISGSQLVTIRIQNLLGEVVYNSSIHLRPGDHEFSLITGSAGIFIISMITEQGTLSFKAISDRPAGTETRVEYLGIKEKVQPGLKKAANTYFLGYQTGQIILFKCYGGNNTTVVTDSPAASKNYVVRFVSCSDKDGKNYPVVYIGEQTWMAENLAYLPAVVSSNYRSAGQPYYYVYDYNGESVAAAKVTAKYKTYGVLYNWSAACKSCPQGWHLPVKEEWEQLIINQGDSTARSLAETTIKHWKSFAGTTNSSGFTALPGGATGNISGSPTQVDFDGQGYFAEFWTETQGIDSTYGITSPSAWHVSITGGWGMYWTLVNFWMNNQSHWVNSKGYGYSVRCLYGVAASVNTMEITGITGISAQGGGEVTDDGNMAVTSRGVCWSTLQNPTINDNKTVDGQGTGSFTSSLTGLNPNTSYYARAYAVNSYRASYGKQIIFKTGPGIPTVKTSIVLSLTESSAVSGGTITNNGGLEITDRGVCWSLTRNPSVTDNTTYDGDGEGKFVSSITRLSPNTTHYVRAYASNSAGTAYGDEREFRTASGSFFYEGKSYPYRQFGNQNWMIENLAYLPAVYTPSDGTDISPRYYVYGYNGTKTSDAKATANYSSYGVLYNFEASKTACPTGWYLPGDSDWIQLTDYLTANGYGFGGGGIDIAKSMAAKWGWKFSNKGGTPGFDQESNDSSGFSVVPAGNRNSSDFSDLGSGTSFWTIAANETAIIRSPMIWYSLENITTNAYEDNTYGHSVRCVNGGTYLAKITTSVPEKPSGSSVLCGGNIIDDGETGVKARGVCWSINKNPTVLDSKTIDGSGKGKFTSEITGLGGYQTYYVRAYAINSTGTSYGTNEILWTSAGWPTVTPGYLSSIRDTSAISGGIVKSNGGYAVTARGVCWATTENPTTSDNSTLNGSGVGGFSSQIVKLKAHTTYYVRAYAINSAGTGYSNNIRFRTADSSFIYEGNNYYYKTIGSQIWMTENLAYLPSVNYYDSKSATSGRYYVYGYNGTKVENAKASENYKTYGVLYNRPAAMKGASGSYSVPSGVKGICPEGWHLPSDGEWEILMSFLGGGNVAGGKMKEPGESHWQAPNTDATNESGFSALPGGSNDNNLDFADLGRLARFSSSTDSNQFWSSQWGMFSENGKLFQYSGYYEDAYSVRCLKNNN